MGTRGFLGIRIGGIDKIQYNQYDSYPECLGNNIATSITKMIADLGMSEVKNQAKNIRLVDGDSIPTQHEQETLKEYADLSVSNRTLKEWYCLLRRTQGDLDLVFKCGVIEDASSCLELGGGLEWGYIVNLDEEVFEVYNCYRDTKALLTSRFDSMNVKLIARYPLNAIRADWVKQANNYVNNC